MNTIVSQAQLKRYHIQLTALAVFVITMGIIVGLRVFDGKYLLLFIVPMITTLPISIYKQFSKMRSVSYDESNLYFRTMNSTELHKVTFDNIRSIHMGKLDKIYKINFVEAIEGLKAVHFKPSRLWGPFSNIKDEKKVHGLCDAINAHLGITKPEEQLHVYQTAATVLWLLIYPYPV